MRRRPLLFFYIYPSSMGRSFPSHTSIPALRFWPFLFQIRHGFSPTFSIHSAIFSARNILLYIDDRPQWSPPSFLPTRPQSQARWIMSTVCERRPLPEIRVNLELWVDWQLNHCRGHGSWLLLRPECLLQLLLLPHSWPLLLLLLLLGGKGLEAGASSVGVRRSECLLGRRLRG